MSDEKIPSRDHLAEAKNTKHNLNVIGAEGYFQNAAPLVAEAQLDAMISAAESARVQAIVAVILSNTNTTILLNAHEERSLINEAREILGLDTPEES